MPKSSEGPPGLCDAVDNLYRDPSRPISSLNDRLTQHRGIDIRTPFAHLDGRNSSRIFINRIGQLLGRGPAVLAVVLDAEVLVGPAGVVRRRQNKSTEHFFPLRPALPDQSTDSRRGS